MNINRVLVTPAQAKEWLSTRNTRNRPINAKRVAMLTATIAAGHWLLTHQGIAFDSDGLLIDGQHRLAAVVQSGKSVEMIVSTDLPETTWGVVDTDLLPRTSAHVLSREDGTRHASSVVAVANALRSHLRPSTFTSSVFDDRAFAAAHKHKLDWLTTNVWGVEARRLFPATAAAVVLVAMYIDQPKVVRFVQCVTGADEEANSDASAYLRTLSRWRLEMQANSQGRKSFMYRCAHVVRGAVAGKVTTVARASEAHMTWLMARAKRGGMPLDGIVR